MPILMKVYGVIQEWHRFIKEISLDEGEHTVDAFIAAFDTHTKNSMSEAAHASLEAGLEDLALSYLR